MLGMLTNLAGIALVGPAILGVGAFFGGRQLIDQRRRDAEARRQEAIRFTREFIAEVRFAAQRHLRDYASELRRGVRDHFVQRLRELERTYGDAANSLVRARDREAPARERNAEL